MKGFVRKNAIVVYAVFSIVFFMISAVFAELRADETPVPAFGEGKVNVRLYTDYFCPPCRDMEPDIEPILLELDREKLIRLIFIDSPFYRYSSLYARYFLYAVNEKRTLENALRTRRSLIEAAKKNIDDPLKLEAFLKEKKIAFKAYDVKPVFNALSRYLTTDKIEKTPTCLIEINGKTYKHEGGPDITAALGRLRQKKPDK